MLTLMHAVFNAARSLQRSRLWPQHDDPVLIVLDGDDWLFDDSSLWTVAAYYASTLLSVQFCNI